MKIKNRNTLIVWALIFYILILLLFNLGNSVMPLFLKNTPFGTTIFGYLMAFMFLGQFIVAPFWGNLSDSKGRVILAISPVGYGIGQVLYVFSAHSLVLLIFSRVFSGIFSILFLSQFVAFISDIAPEENRQQVLSITAIMGPLGGGIAYLIGGLIKTDYFANFLLKCRDWLSIFGTSFSDRMTEVYTFPFFLQLVFGTILTFVLYFFIKDNSQYQELKVVEQESVVKNPLKRMLKQFTVLNDYKGTLVFSVIAISFFNSFAYTATQSIQYYLQDGLGLDAAGIGLVVFFYNIGSVIISVAIQSMLLRKNSNWTNLLLANSIVIVFALLLLFANVWQLTVIMSIIIMMNTLLVSIIQGTLVNFSPQDRGILLGLNQSVMSLASIIGNFIVSPLYSFKPEVLNYRLPFMMMSFVLFIVTLIILFPLKRQMKK